LLTSPAFDGAAVLGTVKAKPFVVVQRATARKKACGAVEQKKVSACVRRRSENEETGFQIEQRNEGRKMRRAC